MAIPDKTSQEDRKMAKSSTARVTEQAAHPETRAQETRLIPVPRWNDFHVWPPIGGLRHLIFHETTNGFSECVVRIGRRVLIDEQKFFAWAAKAR